MAAPAVTSATNEVERFLEEAKQTEAARRKGELARNTLELKLARFDIDRFLQAKKADYIRKGLTACSAPQREQYNSLVHGLEEQSQKIADYLRAHGAGWWKSWASGLNG